jgi:hypothetical protein
MSRFSAAAKMVKVMDDPTPAPTPTPAPPAAPDIDFSKIDTPEKAALTPALNPAIIVAAAATFAASMGGNGAMATAVQLAMGSSTTGSLNYTVFADQATQSVGLKGAGMLGDQPFAETWTLNTQNQDPSQPILNITGTIGNNAENLAVSVDQQAQVIKIDGNVGDVDVHHNITFRQGPNGDNPTVIVGGTMGGVALYEELAAVVDQSNPNQAGLNITGTLGDKNISNSLQAQVQNPNDPKSMAVNFNASGNIAGNNFNMTGSISPATKK